MMAESDGFGFKRVTLENWLLPDPVWRQFAHPLGDAGTAWVRDVMQYDLASTVPLQVRRLFEVARGSIGYGFVFYPLLTLGTEQIFRVLEAAVANKCIALQAPANVRKYFRQIEWLCEAGYIPERRHQSWDDARQLRNLSSHLRDQSIFDPNVTLERLRSSVEMINELFQAGDIAS